MTTAVTPAPSKSAAQRKRSSARGPSQGTRRGNTIAGIAAWASASLFVFPVLWMVLTSLHSEPDAATNPPASSPRSPSTATRSSSAHPPGPAPGRR